jgi:U3 small nucleolar RNA-associated protein 21
MHNLRFDTTLFTFTVPDAQITSISFRTDGPSVLAAATDAGRVTVWDLEGKKLIAVMKDVHQGPVVAARFLPEQPVMITSGTDNAIKMWIFDHADQKPRLLRERSGHSRPPRRIRYYGDGTKAGNVIVSAGSDRSLRIFSTVQEQQSRELSQGHLKKSAKRLRMSEHQLKLPSIFHFDSCTTASVSSVVHVRWWQLVSLTSSHLSFAHSTRKGAGLGQSGHAQR